MGLLSLLKNAQIKDRRDVYIALTAPLLGLLTIKLISNLLLAAKYNGILPKAQIYKAPSQNPTSPYPPTLLPGGRNIPTPYGTLRAYEWGPKHGRKVLCIHGISTPSIALARLAKQLVEVGGCRVCLFDLFGRGYSDAPDPRVHRQDLGLFMLQIWAVVGSSEVNWGEGFTLCGYSLGGGIAASFTSYFPRLVESLVLIAPGGVLRTNRISWGSRLLYSGVLPDFWVHYIVWRKIRAGSNGKPPKSFANDRKFSATDAAAEEIAEANSAHAQDSASPLFEDRPHISSATAVAWQLESHPGFIPSFVSSVKYAPIHDGHARWRVIGERCAAQRNARDSGDDRPRGLREGKVLVLLGAQDRVISSDETGADAEEAFGKENTKVVRVAGNHDLVVTNAEGCVEAMMEFWKSGL